MAPTGNGTTEPHWRMDKRVPIAFLAALGLQTGLFLWYAATFTAEVTAALEVGVNDRQRIESRLQRVEGERDDFSDRLTRVEVHLQTQNVTLQEILKELRKR